MNDLPPSAVENNQLNAPLPSSDDSLSTEPASKRKNQKYHEVILIAVAVLALLLAAQWWKTRNEIKTLRKEIAQRLQTGEASNNETKNIAKSVLDNVKEIQAKVNAVEGKQIEAQSQQVALEQLYQEFYKNRDEWALTEIEQVLSTASQQLQLAGNVQGALIALQSADNRLALSDKPQFITIRRAIASDMEQLKALPTVDLTGLALKIDSIIGQIDRMPLLVDEKTPVPATQPKNVRQSSVRADGAPSADSGADANAYSDWLTRLQGIWHSWTNEMWMELRQLVRIRKVETPDALLLSPTEAFYARENLKLRLLNARLALLSRNESTFRNDLIAAQDMIAKYFDPRAKQTQAVQALLRQVQASTLTIEMPTLSDSLEAVRNHYRTKQPSNQ